MKLLLTGVAGFIGSHLARALLLAGHKVIGIDNLNDYYSVERKLKNLKELTHFTNFVFIKNDALTTTAIQDHKPEVVVHLAAMAGVRYSLQNPTTYVRNNVEVQTHLLLESVKHNVKRFIYASSSSVYGKNSKVPFNEEDTLNSINSPYAATKRCCEIVADLYNRLYSLPAVGLRFFTVYGPRGRPDMAPYKFLYAIKNNIPINKYGDGTSSRDYTYIDDIVSGIIAAINHTNTDHTIYNLGNSSPVTLNEFIRLCEKVTKKNAIINQMGDQQGDVPHTYADISKAKKELNYEPQTPLEEGLQKTLNSL